MSAPATSTEDGIYKTGSTGNSVEWKHKSKKTSVNVVVQQYIIENN